MACVRHADDHVRVRDEPALVDRPPGKWAQRRLLGRGLAGALRRVTITIQYYGSGAWRKLTTAKAGTTGGFASSWKAGSRGTWSFRAVFGGDASHTGSTSGVVKVLVQ